MSRKHYYPDLILWAVVGLAGAVASVWAFPRAYPFFPADWRLHRGEAVERALGQLRALGETVEDFYVVAGLAVDPALEHRLQLAAEPGRQTALAESAPGRRILAWGVTVYPKGVRTRRCSYCLEISPAGEVTSLDIRVPPAAPEPSEGTPQAAGMDPAAARVRAAEVLRSLGLAPERFAEPETRRVERPGRTDVVVRYRDREAALGSDFPYGVEVTFAGDRLATVSPWLDDPDRDQFPGPWPEGLLWRIRLLAPFLLLPFVVVPFLRRYHEGQAGLRQGRVIFFSIVACGALAAANGAAWCVEQGWMVGATARQATWVWRMQFLLLITAPLALTAAVAWAAAEAGWRQRWGAKLAAFDAVLRGRFGSATVARASIKGPAAGLALAAALLLALPALPRLGIRPLATWLFEPLTVGSPWVGLGQLALTVMFVLFTVLAELFLLLPARRWLGRAGGVVAVAAVSGVIFYPPLATYPPGSEVLVGAAVAAAVAGLLLACDLLTAVLAALTTHLTLAGLPWLFAHDAFLNLQGALPLAVVALPLLLSWRGLRRGGEAVYQWQDVPPHARRIAERERRRMELETARAVQRSILPQLPRQLDGVELAHAYRPAGEVGGDFYDVTALADGRLALAVGDVAGHGVASGLVMSMARSALAVQVGADPAVEAVFRTLNRTLHVTAHKSLLATLCYGVLDPRRRELVFASAGHLCPYLIRRRGGVVLLEAPAYPLGVRPELEIFPQRVGLAAGDILFLCSDGVVEAHPEDGDDPFGFERLEESLRRHANGSTEALRDGVLADVTRYAGAGPLDDDQTILVLRLPVPPDLPESRP